ncbi:MAG TPA: HAD-IIA family hydrolase [Gammaproteobacteria bacterium]
MTTMPPVATDIEQLLGHYELLLLDAYGVLLDKQGPLPGARELIVRLNGEQRPYYILTNSASRLPENFAAELQAMGLPVPQERLITSGTLLAHHFAAHHLSGKPCLVLGPENSAEYVRRAGGVVMETCAEAEVVVLADQAGFPLLEGINCVLNLILRRLDQGKPIELLLCNPDLIYPVTQNEFGITAGALAQMLEAILRERYPGKAHHFIALGKPHRPMFAAALDAHPDKRALMIGDQLATDILGANRYGIDSVLVMSGVARQVSSPLATPDYLLATLETHT